ncbi:MAG: nitronate monooxygenase [Limnohabitans sp.]
MHTSFFDAHAIRLVQAPMAGSQNHALAAAVFQAGGLGSIPAAMLNAEQLQTELAAFLKVISTQGPSRSSWGHLLPLNVNFFCHTPPQAQPNKEAAWRQHLHPAYLSHGIDPASVGSGPGRAPFSEESLALMGLFKPAVVSFHFGLPKPEWVQQLKAWVRNATARCNLRSATAHRPSSDSHCWNTAREVSPRKPQTPLEGTRARQRSQTKTNMHTSCCR